MQVFHKRRGGKLVPLELRRKCMALTKNFIPDAARININSDYYTDKIEMFPNEMKGRILIR